MGGGDGGGSSHPSGRSVVPANRGERRTATGYDAHGRGAQEILRRIAAVTLLLAWIADAGTMARAQQEPDALLERRYLTGEWRGVRPTLQADGVAPYLTYTGLLWGNVDGGREQGVRVNGFLNFGTDIDFAKLGTWSGFGAHIDFHWWQGPEPTVKLIGGLLAMGLSGWEAADTFRVYNIYLRQSFADDRWVVKIGQIAADTDFMISRYGGVFLNAAFGDLPSQNLNLDAPVYPLAAPGAYGAARPLPWLTGRFGAYTGDAGDDVAGNHGFGWGLGNNAGYTFFWELAASGAAAGASTYTLGAIYDTGGSAQFGTGAERSAHYELYAMIDQALLMHGDDPLLGAFARMSGSPQDARNVVSVYADAGLAVFGPFWSRPDDVTGVAVSILRFTNDFQSSTTGVVGSGEIALEVTYQAAIAPWLIVQPDFQCFFDPPISGRDAQALGVQAVAVF
jgi:porin